MAGGIKIICLYLILTYLDIIKHWLVSFEQLGRPAHWSGWLNTQHLIVNYNSVKMVIFKLQPRLLRSDTHCSMLTQTDDGCLKVIILFIIFDHLSLWESCNHYTKISWTQNISYHYIENIWNQSQRLRVWSDEKSSEEIYSWMFVDLDSAIKSLLACPSLVSALH